MQPSAHRVPVTLPRPRDEPAPRELAGRRVQAPGRAKPVERPLKQLGLPLRPDCPTMSFLLKRARQEDTTKIRKTVVALLLLHDESLPQSVLQGCSWKEMSPSLLQTSKIFEHVKSSVSIYAKFVRPRRYPRYIVVCQKQPKPLWSKPFQFLSYQFEFL